MRDERSSSRPELRLEAISKAMQLRQHGNRHTITTRVRELHVYSYDGNNGYFIHGEGAHSNLSRTVWLSRSMCCSGVAPAAACSTGSRAGGIDGEMSNKALRELLDAMSTRLSATMNSL